MLLWRLFARVILWCLVLCFAICGSSGDAHAFTYSKKNKKRTWNTSIGVGVRYFTHYNRERVLSTPPETAMGELQLTASFRQVIAIYGFVSTGVAKADSFMLGAGLKLPFLTLNSGRKGVVGGLNLFLLADGGMYSLQEPVFPEDYISSGFLFRYGAGAGWNFGATKLYLDTTLMVTDMNDNFFIAPYIGIGLGF
jgi:hypothetical protein